MRPIVTNGVASSAYYVGRLVTVVSPTNTAQPHRDAVGDVESANGWAKVAYQ